MTALSENPNGCRAFTSSLNEGMSNRVIAERAEPFEQEVDPDGLGGEGILNLVGDKFIATYLHGPFGVITRTDERFDSDPGNNRDAYYASDATGGNVALIIQRDRLRTVCLPQSQYPLLRAGSLSRGANTPSVRRRWHARAGRESPLARFQFSTAAGNQVDSQSPRGGSIA